MSKTMLVTMVALLLVVGAQAWATDATLVSVGNWVFVDNPTVGQMKDPADFWGVEPQPTDLDAGIDGAVLALQVAESAGGPFTDVLVDGLPYTATTSGGGYYYFEGLPANKYYKVTIVSLPAEYAAYVETYERSDDADGSPANRSSVNFVASTELTPWGEAGDMNFDFGFNPQEPGGWMTFTQGGWGAKPTGGNVGSLLHSNWLTVYPGGTMTVGSPNSLTFTNPWAITDFLPQGATAGVLIKSYVDPVKKTEAGVLAGQVVALKLNVDFSAMGVTPYGLGALKIQTGPYATYTVAQLLGLAQAVLGGDTSGLQGSISDLSDACTAVNENFDDGADNGFLAR